MDEKVKKYRKKYPKCSWCKYYEHIYPKSYLCFNDFEKCALKDNIIYFEKIKARLCRWYEVGEDK